MNLRQRIKQSEQVDLFENVQEGDTPVVDTAPRVPLTPRQPHPPVARINRRLLGILLAVGVGLGAWMLSGHTSPPGTNQAEAPPLAVAPPPPEELTRLPKNYGDIVRPQASSIAPPPAAPPPPEAPPKIPMATPMPEPKPAPAVAPPPVSHAPDKPKPKPEKWLFVNLNDSKGTPPFPLPKIEETKALAQTKAEGLIPAATWAKPLRPTRVWYRDMPVRGLSLDAINSDVPGSIRIMVTSPLMDRFQSGEVLIEQFSTIVGRQEMKATYGQQRLDVTVEQVITPAGTVIALNKPKLGDVSGAAGLNSQVNNHYLQLGVAALLSAALSVGARVPAGSQSGYAPNLPQEFSGDIAASFNRSGQDIVKRELLRPPTLTAPAGSPVTLQLLENVSLMTQPILVTK